MQIEVCGCAHLFFADVELAVFRDWLPGHRLRYASSMWQTHNTQSKADRPCYGVRGAVGDALFSAAERASNCPWTSRPTIRQLEDQRVTHTP